jgi:Zn-dependent protease
MKLGKIGNTQFEIGQSFLFLVAFILFSYLRAYDSVGLALIQGLTTIVLLTGILVCHEMGHIKAAEKTKLAKGKTTLTLWALGGVAQIPSLSTATPRQELITSVAGPAVNLVFALVSLPLMWLLGTHGLDDLYLRYDPSKSYLQFFMNYFFVLNILTGVFNMLPGFPMDGGRTLRSILAMNMSHLSATTIAVYTAWVVGGLMIVSGLWLGAFMMALIGGFVILGSWAELRRVRQKAMAEMLGFEVVEDDKLL